MENTKVQLEKGLLNFIQSLFKDVNEKIYKIEDSTQCYNKLLIYFENYYDINSIQDNLVIKRFFELYHTISESLRNVRFESREADLLFQELKTFYKLYHEVDAIRAEKIRKTNDEALLMVANKNKNSNSSEDSEGALQNEIKWTGKKMDFAEVLLALKISGKFKKGDEAINENEILELFSFINCKNGDSIKSFNNLRTSLRKGNSLFTKQMFAQISRTQTEVMLKADDSKQKEFNLHGEKITREQLNERNKANRVLSSQYE